MPPLPHTQTARELLKTTETWNPTKSLTVCMCVCVHYWPTTGLLQNVLAKCLHLLNAKHHSSFQLASAGRCNGFLFLFYYVNMCSFVYTNIQRKITIKVYLQLNIRNGSSLHSLPSQLPRVNRHVSVPSGRLVATK